jgi:hypothetical protein
VPLLIASRAREPLRCSLRGPAAAAATAADWPGWPSDLGSSDRMNSPSLLVVVPTLAACCALTVTLLRRSSPPADGDRPEAAGGSSSAALAAGGPRDDTSCAIGIYEAENARNASMLCGATAHSLRSASL